MTTLGIASKAHADMARYGVDFDMAPRARSTIQVSHDRPEEDVAAKFLDGKAVDQGDATIAGRSSSEKKM